MERKKKQGRPKLAAPRLAKRVYMSQASLRDVAHWQSCRHRDGVKLSFSEAVREMLQHASVYGVDIKAAHHIVPVSQVFGALWLRRARSWIRIDPNTGRTCKCMRCGTVQEIEAVRFSGILRAIKRFFFRHAGCEKAKVAS